MKVANNFLSATAMVATSEAVVMGVKAGLDPGVMIEVINSGSGMNTASRDKFPRAVLPRSFDYGFSTAMMVKDVRLCVEEIPGGRRQRAAHCDGRACCFTADGRHRGGHDATQGRHGHTPAR